MPQPEETTHELPRLRLGSEAGQSGSRTVLPSFRETFANHWAKSWEGSRQGSQNALTTDPTNQTRRSLAVFNLLPTSHAAPDTPQTPSHPMRIGQSKEQGRTRGA